MNVHPPQPRSLHARLRTATAVSHQALEDKLDLLRPPLAREHYIHLLMRFHGFHQAWEPTLARHLGALTPRSRLALLEQDLRALGLQENTLRTIAPCTLAATLGADPDTALGSVYVLEGSTLGGRVILRHLRQAPWCPAEGLRYFDPYGDDTAAHWRQTLALLSSSGGDPDRIVAGAVRTFEVLQQWFESPCPVRVDRTDA